MDDERGLMPPVGVGNRTMLREWGSAAAVNRSVTETGVTSFGAWHAAPGRPYDCGAVDSRLVSRMVLKAVAPLPGPAATKSACAPPKEAGFDSHHLSSIVPRVVA